MVTKFKLKNGLTVLYEPVANVASVSVGLWIKTGSREERVSQYGYAHFVEHMLFKGTKKYSAKELARLVDRVGGQHNAATNREYTCYYISVVHDHLELAFDVLSDMFYEPLFDKAELDREKNIIIEEIRMYDDAPDEFIHDAFLESMLNEHPLSHPILGSIEGIEATTSESLRDFYSEHYTNDNAILVIAGKIDESLLEDLASKYFEPAIRKDKASIIAKVDAPKRIYTRHIERDLEQVHFCLGTEGFSRTDKDRWIMYSLSTILGGNMSSRLFQNVREEHGISYSIYSFHSSYSDTGVFGIYCATSPGNFSKGMDLILQECRNIGNCDVIIEEIEDSKTYMKGNLALSYENIEVRMAQMAKNELVHGRLYSYDDINTMIDSITTEDFYRVSEHLLKGTTLSLVSIGSLPVDIESINLKI
ncbi:MAG: pitrilysin family protein [Bacteroidales bacterium]|jgi:predicted Zn-dependent peptidase|nr:pitrilysin family protein [Bacteroidales bacterium]